MGSVLSIIICTYDREVLLRDCIQSLIDQVSPNDLWEVIVVNNHKKKFDSETTAMISTLRQSIIVDEKISGLSHARNTAIKKSSAPWLAFLDDDATVPKDYITRILEIIKASKFDCFGGHIISWWRYGKPRWLADDFGSKPILKNTKGTLIDGFNWGSNIVIRRSALNEVGGFSTDIGMKGYQLGYAAENIVQIQLRERGFLIGYDPDLYVNHVVMPQKLKLSWHVKSAFATGRDGKNIFPDQYNFWGIILSFKNCFSRPIKSIYFLIIKRDFYWENAILESVRPYAILIGKVKSIF